MTDVEAVARRFVADVWNARREESAYELVAPECPGLGGGTGTSLPSFVTNQVAGIEWVKALLGVRTSAARDIITYWVALLLAAATILAVYLLLRSRHGLALSAIRDAEPAAESVWQPAQFCSKSTAPSYIGSSCASSMFRSPQAPSATAHSATRANWAKRERPKRVMRRHSIRDPERRHAPRRAILEPR